MQERFSKPVAERLAQYNVDYVVRKHRDTRGDGLDYGVWNSLRNHFVMWLDPVEIGIVKGEDEQS